MNPSGISSSEMDTLIETAINSVALITSRQSLGLVHHRPERWAQPAGCIENVARKVTMDGGRAQYGWTFHHRFVETIPGPGYLFLTHHAVWQAPTGEQVNVTPYPVLRHFPLPRPGAHILFLVDDSAMPIVTEQLIAPLALRFFAITQEAAIVAHVNRLNETERKNHEEICAGARQPK
jgi:hypothetical protein